RHEIDTIVNFAAETHVDRSLARPDLFFHTNLIGTVCLLRCARDYGIRRFVQISTDEVYGSTPRGLEFDETAPLKPSSPYAASKAAADLAVLAYVTSYDFPALIVRGCNNYGPRQYPEKLIPYFVCRALERKTLPLYGAGENERDWIHVRDFSSAVALVLEKGADGEIYNVPGGARIVNSDIAGRLIKIVGNKDVEIERVADRPGHDLRYRISGAKINALGFAPEIDFDTGLEVTVRWYIEHRDRLRLLPEWERPLSDSI
ncbi:MAG: GDP-mannose 4,6-dehydratase, partial [Candidatus Zixiibacteriota bacterium]